MNSQGNINIEITCKNCGKTFTIRDLIVNIKDCYVNLNVFRTITSCCESYEELALENGLALRGYVYAAGQPHFAAMEKYDADDLSVDYSENDVQVEFENKIIKIRRK